MDAHANISFASLASNSGASPGAFRRVSPLNSRLLERVYQISAHGIFPWGYTGLLESK